MHLVNGYDLQITKFQRLHYILRGIKRVKGVPTRTRLPITLDHLKLFHRILHSRTSPTHDETMIWAAISIAFFGFLRIGEMTCSGPYNSSTNLCRSDVSFHNKKRGDNEVFLQLRIKASKTDPFRASATITIGSNSGMYCPVRALQTYLSRAPTDYAGPLFCYSNGVPLSRSQFTKELRILLAQGGHHPAHYAGHSFRIGAATTAASQGLPHWLIQTLGRWSSDCYLRYIRTPINVLTDVSKRLIAEWDKHSSVVCRSMGITHTLSLCDCGGNCSSMRSQFYHRPHVFFTELGNMAYSQFPFTKSLYFRIWVYVLSQISVLRNISLIIFSQGPAQSICLARQARTQL